MMSPEIRDRLLQGDTQWHQELLGYCMKPIEAAERRWSQRHERWRECEQIYRAYRVPDEQDKITKRQSLTEGVQKIVVPYSFATVQSKLAFFMSILTERLPIIPVRGNGPADVMPAMLMEEVLQYQLDNMEPAGTLVIFQWLLDGERYGLGVVKNTYTVREWVDLVRRFGSVFDPMTGQMVPTDDVAEEDVVAYEGNECLNVAPFDFLPDPQRPMAEFQKGEFVAHRMRRSETELTQREAEGLYAGVGFIKDAARRSEWNGGSYSGPGASDLARTVDMDETDSADVEIDGRSRKPYVAIHEMYRWVQPRDLERFHLPHNPTKTPKLWVFTIGNRARVLRAEPANLPGHRFPFEIYEPNYDVHSPANLSTIETIKDLQYHLSWLFNSRMMSVRKTLNNELIYDQDMIDDSDIRDPQPGKLIRLTKNYAGSGVPPNAVFPIPTRDVTAAHHQDAQIVRQIAEEVTAASRNVMGMPNTGRRSASEVQGTSAMSAGRMKMEAEIFVSQGLRPLAAQMAKNTQVFTSESLNLRVQEQYARVIGADNVTVLPQMLQGNFSFPILEGGMPTDRQLESQLWRELLTQGMQTGVAMPVLQGINWMQVMVMFLRSMGIRNFKDFIAPTPDLQVMPDQMVQDQVQQGNLVPSVGPQVGSDGGVVFPNGQAPMTGDNGMTMPMA